jgi:ribosomal protein S18 acetylase RimI-like enzyme
MSDRTVREYAERDRGEVVALWNRVFADDPPRNAPERVIDRKLGTQRELFLVAERRGRIVGTVLGGYDGFRGWVYHLAVDPEHRRDGIGRELMQEIERRLRTLGCPKINLQIRAHNSGVRAFYERLGFGTEAHISMGKELVP